MKPGRIQGTDTPNEKFAYGIRNDKTSWVSTSTLNPAGKYVTTYTLYDGLLRTRQTQVPSVAGGRLLTDLFYDTSGRKVREQNAYFAAGAPSGDLNTATDRQDVPKQIRTVYDGAGRVTAEIFQPNTTERWRTTTPLRRRPRRRDAARRWHRHVDRHGRVRSHRGEPAVQRRDAGG